MHLFSIVFEQLVGELYWYQFYCKDWFLIKIDSSVMKKACYCVVFCKLMCKMITIFI